ncbi:efflux RND transporter permease subunit, partial [bacterium]|nr:efflux RND transporter permease subunit [bacterium]
MKGLVRWSVASPVAANMLMALILIGGLMSVFHMRREMFPEFALDMISVVVPYPGASPEEVEEGICVKIEEQIKGVAGIKRVLSSAMEGAGTVQVELETGEDQQEVYNDIKNEIDRIITFPVEAEKPIITSVAVPRDAVYVMVYGNASERVLREMAERVREDLTALPDLSLVELVGARDYEISIEVSEESLRRYGLSFDQVASAVSRGSLDLPAGRIRSAQGEILIRAKGQRYTGEEFAGIPVVTLPDGALIRLGEIADVRDIFEEVDRYARFDGMPAVALHVMHTEAQDIIDVVDTVEEYVRRKSVELPEGVHIDTAFDTSVLVRDRLHLLVKNGLQGLVLVFLTLGLFLRWRLAFWVALGIPISFMGGLIILRGLDGTLNMISLFAFIMSLGIVVDDA